MHLEYTSFDGQIKYADYDYYDFVPDQGVFAKSYMEYPYDFCSETILCDYICGMIDEGEYCFALWNETIITNYLYKKQNPEFTGMGVLFTVMIEIRKYFIPKDILIMKTGNMRRYHLTSFMKLFRIVRKKEKLR